MEWLILALVAWLAYEHHKRTQYRRENDDRFARLADSSNDKEEKLRKSLSGVAARVAELEKHAALAPASAAPIAPLDPVVKAPVASLIADPPVPVAPTVAPPPQVAEPQRPPVQVLPPAVPPVAKPWKPIAAPPPVPRVPPPKPAEPKPSAPLAAAPVVPSEARKPPMTVPTPSPPEPTRVWRAPSPTAAAFPPAPPAARVPWKNAFDIEEKLGKNWLNKLAIVFLVIGIALWVAYKLPALGPAGKVLVGYATSLGMLAAGVFFERNDRYRILARTGIGGGWALLFFVTYAMHHVAAARVIETQWIDLVLLFLAAAGMVAHTLRYDSQVVTGLAFLLGFATVTINCLSEKPGTVYSLTAGAILALGLVAVVRRKRWFELEIFGLLASYLNHYLWLRTIIEPMAGHKRTFPEFLPSALLLVMYWAIFRWSYIARRVESVNEERASTLAALLNTFLLLGVMKYQAVQSGLAFYALLGIGAVELTLAQLPITRRRRIAFVILSTVGVTLLVAAIPFKFSGANISILWLAEGQALFLAGVFTREPLFRRFGLLAALLTTGHMLGADAGRVFVVRNGAPSDMPEYALALCFAVAAALFYANSHWIPGRRPDLIASELEGKAYRVLSYVAGVLLLVGAWLAFPYSRTAVAWGALALVLGLAARRSGIVDLSVQGNLFAVASFAAALIVNRAIADPYLYLGLTQRVWVFALVAGVFYACARWSWLPWAESARRLSEVYSAAASFLVVAAIYFHFDSALAFVWTAVAWAGFSLLLALLGRVLDRPELSYQGHVIATAAFLRALLVNLDATRQYAHMTLRLITFSLVAGQLYVCARLSGPRGSGHARVFSAAYTWAGSALVAVLAYQELPSEWIAVAWAALALPLLVLGSNLKRGELPLQAHALVAVAFIRALAVNVVSTQPFADGITLRLVTVSLLAALLYVCARWVKRWDSERGPISAGYTWMGSVLVAVLAWQELRDARPVWIAVAWAAFGFSLLVAGKALKRIELTYQAYLLAPASLACTLLVNLEAGEPSGFLHPRLTLRLLTAGIVAALFYVSSRWAGRSEVFDARPVGSAYTWAGSLLVSLLMWYELRPLNVALAWVMLGFVLFEWGIVRQSVSWRMQSYVAFVSGFTRVFFVNLNARGWDLVASTLPLALVFYYAYWRLGIATGDEIPLDRRLKSRTLLSYFGTVTLLAMLRFSLDPDWVAAGWAAVVVILLGTAWRSQREIFLHHGYLAGIAIMFRIVFHNFSPGSHESSGWYDSRAVQVGSAAALLFLALPFAFPIRKRLSEQAGRSGAARTLARALRCPEQAFFFAPLLLVTVLSAREVSQGRVTVAWGLEAVLVFMFALWVGERSFRLTGLGLLLLCVGKIVLLDVWRQEKIDRFVTFIILGASLMLVSFLYTRYSETIRRYL